MEVERRLKMEKHVKCLDNFLDVLKESGFIRIDVFNKSGLKEAPVHLYPASPMFAEIVDVLEKGLSLHRKEYKQELEQAE